MPYPSAYLFAWAICNEVTEHGCNFEPLLCILDLQGSDQGSSTGRHKDVMLSRSTLYPSVERCTDQPVPLVNWIMLTIMCKQQWNMCKKLTDSEVTLSTIAWSFSISTAWCIYASVLFRSGPRPLARRMVQTARNHLENFLMDIVPCWVVEDKIACSKWA